MNENLTGTVEGIIYRNTENGYSVLEIAGSDGLNFVAVGTVPLAEEGEKLEMQGFWTEHKTYGKQFKVHKYTVMQPTTTDEIETYLGNGTIRGIGKATAKLIVRRFGTETFDILDNTPERLAEIPGIGRVKLEMIINSYNMQRVNRNVMLELQKYDITPTQAIKIYRKYGDDCVNTVRQNPYRLIDDIENIGFKTADKIARSVGIAYNSEFRIKAGIRFVLEWAQQEGHTYLPYDVLISATVKTIGVEETLVRQALDSLIELKVLVKNTVDEADIVFLPKMRRMELDIATRLSRLALSNKGKHLFDIELEVLQTAKRNGIELAKKQLEALKALFSEGVTVITGGPGTGKTTILKIAIEIMKRWNMTFELAAPTGRAAKRMTLATGQEAKTLHRLLEYSFIDKSFLRDENDPIDADFVIIDEMSMVDVPLMSAFLRAVTDETRVILVGDADQLPSVGAGNVLGDILNSEKLFSVRLTEIYRQAESSMIISNAHKINNGIYPELDDDESDFNFLELSEPNEVIKSILSLYREGGGGVLRTNNPFDDVQLLAPMKKGLLGVINLNKALQETLNPPDEYKEEIVFGDTVFRVGDKVMQIKNDYSLEWTKSEGDIILEEGKGVFNGDIGVITAADNRNGVLTVNFEDGATVEYTRDLLTELDLAYCISIHKSQGSEFKIVLMALAGGPPSFLTRNLLYTAVTRAKSQVYIIGRRDCINAMVKNKSTKSRYTALCRMIKEYYEHIGN